MGEWGTVNCDGAIGAVQMLVNLCILFTVAIVIEADYAVLIEPLITSTFEKFVQLTHGMSLSDKRKHVVQILVTELCRGAWGGLLTCGCGCCCCCW